MSAADWLERRTPRASAWGGWVRLVREGAVGVLHDPPPDDPMALAAVFLGEVLDAPPEWVAERLTQLPEGLTPSHTVQAAVARGELTQLAAALEARDPRVDVDRVDLAAILGAVGSAQPGTPSELRLVVRSLLEARGCTLAAMNRAVEGVDPALTSAVGYRWPHPTTGETCWLPRGLLWHGTRSSVEAELETVAGLSGVVGIVGGAASGKSTLAAAWTTALEGRGVDVVHLPADAFTLPGDGFRYRQHPGHRDVLLYGPCVYDHGAHAEALTELAAHHRLVLTDGVAVGWDRRVAALLTRLIALDPSDPWRLTAKVLRDDLGGRRRIDVPTDFAHKVFHEHDDVVWPLLSVADAVI